MDAESSMSASCRYRILFAFDLVSQHVEGRIELSGSNPPSVVSLSKFVGRG